MDPRLSPGRDLNPRWPSARVYDLSSLDRRDNAVTELTTINFAHAARRVSDPTLDAAIAGTLNDVGRLPAKGQIQVWKGLRPRLPGGQSKTVVRGKRSDETQAAHAEQTAYITLHRDADPAAFTLFAKEHPQYVENGTVIRAPLHAFASSRLAKGILFNVEKTMTLVSNEENRFNSYTESHGEREARAYFLHSVLQKRSDNPGETAARTLEVAFAIYLPRLVAIASNAIFFYHGLATRTHREEDERIVEVAEVSRDFWKKICLTHRIPPATPGESTIPAMSYTTIERVCRLVREAETSFNMDSSGSPSGDSTSNAAKTPQGWTERAVGAANLVLPPSAVLSSVSGEAQTESSKNTSGS